MARVIVIVLLVLLCFQSEMIASTVSTTTESELGRRSLLTKKRPLNKPPLKKPPSTKPPSKKSPYAKPPSKEKIIKDLFDGIDLIEKALEGLVEFYAPTLMEAAAPTPMEDAAPTPMGASP